MEANQSHARLEQLQSRYDHMGLILKKRFDHYEIYDKQHPNRLILEYHSLGMVKVEIEFREALSRLLVAQHAKAVTKN
jgi:hypothetical protein